METVHCLTYHGRYTFSDVLDMSHRERDWLLQRIIKQYDEEARAAKNGPMMIED